MDLQAKRAKVTDADVNHFMSVRKIEKMPKKWLGKPIEAGKTMFTDRVGNM